MEQFTVKHDDSGFTDISSDVDDFVRDEVLVQLKTTSTLYVGYRKPFNFFFMSFLIVNDVSNTLTLQYHNLTNDVLTDVPNLDEDTEGFTRDAFIKFDRPEKDSTAATDWKKTTIDGKELFWLVITTSDNHNVLTKINGIGILFADDQDLIEERRNIVSKHATNERTLTWVAKHQAARKEIVQAIRNQGKSKIRVGSVLEPSRFMDITEFDFLRLDQIREAAKWLCLAKIFQNELSDASDDKWMALGDSFEEKYSDAFDLFLLSLDTDDDGEEDFSENQDDVKRIDLSFT